MHQVKLFKGLESDVRELEKEVNAWLSDNKARVVNIFGNIAPQSRGKGEALGASGASIPSDLFLAVVYETD